jgi:hypothetical protein
MLLKKKKKAKKEKHACNLIWYGSLVTQWVNLEKLINPFDTLKTKRTNFEPLINLLVRIQCVIQNFFSYYHSSSTLETEFQSMS